MRYIFLLIISLFLYIYIIQMQISKREIASSSLTQEQVINYKKLTLLELETYYNSLEEESQQMDQIYESLLQQLARQNELNNTLKAQIDAEIEINKSIKKQHEEHLGIMPKKVIGQFERSIEANLKICQQLKEKGEELEEWNFRARREAQELEDMMWIKQSELDSIELKSRNTLQRIETEKQKIDEIKAVLKKSSQQQQEMFNLKKKLNNQLQECKGNIRVYCRVRPNRTGNVVVTTSGDNVLKLGLSKAHIIQGKEKFDIAYNFEQLFGQQDSQERVFSEISQLVQSSIDGKNVCIFAYGQTGSGKTFTLMGPEIEYNQSISDFDQRGLTPRSIDLVFQEIHLSQPFKWKYSVFLSIQEIYLQTIIDLIAKGPTTMDKVKEVEISSPLEFQSFLKEANFNRKTASTNMNQRSSRSHLIVSLRLEGVNSATKEIRNGSLVLVDLAGSERIKQSGVVGVNLKETQFINKSLSSLRTVIDGIHKKSQHIPFRNSKLTHVLQRYLEGDSKTLMFVNVSPDQEDASQTKNSLDFAESVKQCKIKK